MAGFTEAERERIREQLIENGRESLLRYGPSKTTVKDVTDPVGIAKPTFYQFFDAKSDLYLVILQRELREYMETVRSEIEAVEDPREALERLFRSYAEFGEGNPFIQQTVIRGNYEEIIGWGSADQLEEFVQTELDEFVPIIEGIRRRSEGPIADMDSHTVLGIMGGSVGLLELHREDYERYEHETEAVEAGYYEAVRSALITMLARGLTAAD
ncbi:MAG: TetR/AcrR family transcriptional regulator [Halodesulfurarchaeum sp.]